MHPRAGGAVRSGMTRRCTLCASLLLLLGISGPVAPALAQPPAAPPAVQPAATTVERWYEVSLGGKHAGYQHEKVTTEKDAITTVQTVVLVIKRGQDEIKNTIESTVVESPEHAIRTMNARTVLGGQPIVAEYVFEGDEVAVTRVSQGHAIKSREKAPKGGWLSPSAAQLYLAKRQAAGAKEISVTTIDPAAGLEPSTDVYTLLEQGTQQAGGKAVKAWKYRVKAGKPKDTEQTVWLDEKAEQIRAEMDLAGSTLVTMATGREAALRAIDAPEIMVATFVKPQGKIVGARELREATYVLRVEGGELPDLPNTGTQTFVRKDKSSGELTLKTDAGTAAPTADAADPTLLASSSWANAEDPEIAGLTKQALSKLGGSATAAEKAEAIRVFVGRYISNKNLGTGFATASEVARTKSGDCTEHAVLTAAMLRAAGIPSRAVSGLVYVDSFEGQAGVFGYHMWAQALLEKDGVKRWTELDATLGSRSYDAAHVALVTSNLKDGEFETSVAPVSKVLGRLKIEVVKTAK